MPSGALNELLDGLAEVQDLQGANPTPKGGMPERPRVVRAINRSSVVLLYSHFERYLRAVNEEAVTVINASLVSGATLPEPMRLRHSQVAVENLSRTQWDRRGPQLSALVERDGWLWGSPPPGQLEPDRLVQWMRGVDPRRIIKFYGIWGVPNVFRAITRTENTRGRMHLKLGELVDKRHSIAHGDATTEATPQDISSYIAMVRKFCTRADRLLGGVVSRVIGVPSIW